MFDLKPSKIIGCFELQPRVIEDARGRFVKTFHEQAFSKLGLETAFIEDYYSLSYKNVIRGLHFQVPPRDHVKLVYCVEGEVMDVVVDLRAGSFTYGQYEVFDLSAVKANSIYIAKGMAHGFCVRSKQAVMVYKVSSVYSPAHDSGVLWNSVGIPWPVEQFYISNRDKTFPALEQFESPFEV